MKRFCSFLFVLILVVLSLPVQAESPRTVTGVDFDFRLALNTEAFPPAQHTRIRGYADLLEALSFRGSFFYEPESRILDLSLEICPVDPQASPVALHFFGYPESVMLSSNLFGDETVVFSNISLLEFVVKIHEHLGLNLQYAALCYPYVYEYSLYPVLNHWKRTFTRKHETRYIPVAKIKSFADYLEYSYANYPNVDLLIRALCLSSVLEETIRSEIYNLPVYLSETLTRGKRIQITVEPGSEVWAVSKKPFYTHTVSDKFEHIETDLPETPGGYQPFLFFSRQLKKSGVTLDLNAGWSRLGDDDLFSCLFYGEDLPTQWPGDVFSQGVAVLTGAIFPNFSFTWNLNADPEGRTILHIGKPSYDANAGELLCAAEGTVLPREFTVREYTSEEIAACVDILRVNDVTLADFKSKIMGDAFSGLIRFLSGIPASACQSMLDDLTDLGVLDLLLTQ